MSKKPPKTERIARMAGKTTFRDFREGFGGGLSTHDSDADIKAALGMARSKVGALPVQILETRYASSLQYERDLRWALDRMLKDEGSRDSHGIAVQRMSAALAIRKFAGARMIQNEVAAYAWLVHCHRLVIEAYMHRCNDWMNDHCEKAKKAFLKAMADIHEEERKKKAA